MGYKQARFDIAADARQTHNLRVTEYQATVVANEPADLEKLLIKSINNPQDNSIGRKKLVESECSAHLGNAAKHIGELMSKLVKA